MYFLDHALDYIIPKPKPNFLTELDDDIFRCVLDYLYVPDMLKLRLTSKEICQRIDNPSIWRALIFKNCPQWLNDSEHPRIIYQRYIDCTQYYSEYSEPGEILRKLLIGAPINYKCLSCAIIDHLIDIVKLLLKFGADVNHKDGYGTPLMCVVHSRPVCNGENCKEKIVKLLIDSGAKFDILYNGIPVLYQAVFQGGIDLVKILLEADAPLTYSNFQYKKVFTIMCERNNHRNEVQKGLELLTEYSFNEIIKKSSDYLEFSKTRTVRDVAKEFGLEIYF